MGFGAEPVGTAVADFLDGDYEWSEEMGDREKAAALVAHFTPESAARSLAANDVREELRHWREQHTRATSLAGDDSARVEAEHHLFDWHGEGNARAVEWGYKPSVPCPVVGCRYYVASSTC